MLLSFICQTFAVRLGRPCSGRTANVYHTFSHTLYYSKIQKHLPHPSHNFYKGSTSAISGLIAQRDSRLQRQVTCAKIS